jgi:hypothetical protein
MSGNFGIVMHIGMLKPPADKYSWIHWDAGGGWAFHPVHLYEVIAKTGTIDNDDVSVRIGKKNLQGISDDLDKLFAREAETYEKYKKMERERIQRNAEKR